MKSVFLEKISEHFQKYKYILIYGAGGVTEDLLRLLEPCLLECQGYKERAGRPGAGEVHMNDQEECRHEVCIVVSDKKENQDFLRGYPVKEILEFCDVQEEACVIISVMPRYEEQIKENLIEAGFREYCTVSALIDWMYREIWSLPVSEHKVIFSNGDGYGFGGNPKYIGLELLRNKADIDGECDMDLVWLANDDQAGLPEGIRVVRYGSYEHYYELGTAKIWIDNQHKSYLTRKRKGQFYMQTWHGGGPLKKIEFDAEGMSDSYRDLCEMNSGMEDVMVSPTRFNSRLYRSAFHYYGEIMECGYPRNDIFWKADGYRRKIEELYQLKPEEGIVLFAPTYREDLGLEEKTQSSGKDARTIEKGILGIEQICQALEERFGKKFKFFIRFHPYDKNPEKRYSWSEEWVNVTAYDDVQELLAVSDILITDYSSVMWDFSLQKKPVFLFHPDLDKYQKERGYYLSFGQMPYIEAVSNEELYRKIRDFDEQSYRKKLDEFLKKYGSFDSGNASAEVAERVITILGGMGRKDRGGI